MSRVKKQCAFIGRSLVWSVALYAVLMLAINWDEVRNRANGTTGSVVVNTTLSPSPVAGPMHGPGISGNIALVKTLLTIARAVCGD